MSDLSWSMFFNGWAPIIRTLVIGSIGYFFLVALLRVSGKRTLSKMNAFDFVVTVAFGSTLASMLTTTNVSLAQGIVALTLLVFLQWVNAFCAVRSSSYQRLIKAQPSLIFFNGDFLPQAMREQRISREEIIAAMRQQGITQPAAVDAVVLETEGSLSVLQTDTATRQSLAQLGVDVGPPSELEPRDVSNFSR
jgi:uncharacterized membrane protein YcaP (DUF421 family)